ncbi:hypothetical protein SMW88_003615 [Cronobacter sakazakii]|uniref:hypothetical protein n=1 Tax=Cronobacter TaxID=413496 RepID=UPI001315458A|nr:MULTISPECIES: hypothetical protein [Cronobacter]EKY1998843.1 hypothetical protein [Cronobacter sakazakii]ELQ6167603.1 hypothetical protein [Cronobacter sakazakii]ELQ6180265.1 hypothetical protein [Cronobacter sakazakii]ELY3422511.1 hypothetical protein [Cronobacter sakazakii]ELY4431864.1 hypothetical protein [Cronobacter sakazakii]
MIENLLTLTGILVSIISAYFAYMAYASSKEVTFPSKNARKEGCVINNLSDEAIAFHYFLHENIDRKVYLNVLFSDEVSVSFPVEDDAVKDYTVMLWDKKFEEIPPGEKPSFLNSSGVEITIEKQEGTVSKFGYARGYYRLQGQFYILGYSGPYQGIMSAVLLPIKLTSA